MAYEINGNIKAFLAVIRHCEGTAGPDGYRTLFGGSLFDDFSRHPNIAITASLRGTPITSTAAGAYQFLYRTWQGLIKQYGYKDFSPETQDQAAVALIRGRKALQDVEEGRFEVALNKCSWEWASLPPGRYGQPIKSVEQCKKIYEQNGGVYMVAPLVAAAATAAGQTFISAAFDALTKELPTLGKLWGSGSTVSDRNIKTIEAAVNIVKDTVGAKNEQEAVEIVRADPALAKAADEAIKASAYELFGVDVSQVGEARKADTDYMNDAHTFWKHSPAFWITVLLLPLLYMTAYIILTGDVGAGFSGEFKAATGAAIVTGILGAVTGFWLGASFTTSRSRGLNATPTK